MIYFFIGAVVGGIISFCAYVIGRRSGITETYHEFEYVIHKWLGDNRRAMNGDDLNYEELCDTFNDMITKYEQRK